MKKFLWLIAALVVAISLTFVVVSCGDGGGSSEETGGEETGGEETGGENPLPANSLALGTPVSDTSGWTTWSVSEVLTWTFDGDTEPTKEDLLDYDYLVVEFNSDVNFNFVLESHDPSYSQSIRDIELSAPGYYIDLSEYANKASLGTNTLVVIALLSWGSGDGLETALTRAYLTNTEPPSTYLDVTAAGNYK